MSRALRERVRANAAFLATAAALLIFLPLFSQFYIVDDAYISFRYARNVALGQGFVFNPGSRVEGVTNLLWTLLLAAAFESGVIDLLGIEHFAIGAGWAFALAATWRTDLVMRALGVRFGVRLGALLVLAATTELWLSMTNGLEGALFAFLLVETLYQTLIRRRVAAGLLAGLCAFLARPEGLLAFPSALASRLVIGDDATEESASRERTRRSLLAAGAAFAAAVLAISLLRYAYFGSLIPNSALAKRPDDLAALAGNLALGQQYLTRTATSNLLLTGSFLAAPCLFLIERVRERRLVLSVVAAALLLGYGEVAAILVYAGDWMPFARLVTPYFFLFAILGALLANVGGGRARPLASGVVASCVVAPALLFSTGTLSRPDWLAKPPTWSLAFQHGGAYREEVPALAACWTTKDVIAAERIGQIGYKLPTLVVHDVLGLTDAHIAHHGTRYYPRFGKTDLAYTLGVVKPTVVIMNMVYLNTLDPEGRRELAAHYEVLRQVAAGRMIAVSREQLARLRPCLRGLVKGTAIGDLP